MKACLGKKFYLLPYAFFTYCYALFRLPPRKSECQMSNLVETFFLRAGFLLEVVRVVVFCIVLEII